MSAITCGLLARMRGTHFRTRSTRELGASAARSLVEPITPVLPSPSSAAGVLLAVITRLLSRYARVSLAGPDAATPGTAHAHLDPPAGRSGRRCAMVLMSRVPAPRAGRARGRGRVRGRRGRRRAGGGVRRENCYGGRDEGPDRPVGGRLRGGGVGRSDHRRGGPGLPGPASGACG